MSQDKRQFQRVGFDLQQRERSGSFFQQDSDNPFNNILDENVDVLSIEKALEIIPEAKSYYGRAFGALGREFTKETEGGYFIRAKAGSNVVFPIQACLYIKQPRFSQKVHNLVIAEPGSRVYIIAGCSAADKTEEAYHLGLSEFFIQKGAYLNFTMIHSWKKDVKVEPKSVALVDEAGVFISNYICLDPVKNISMYPTAVLSKEARASFNSLMVAHPGSFQDIGSRVIFKGPGSSAEIISRAVTLGGTVIARGHLKSESQNTKAHLECRGMIVNETGKIHAIPELETDFRDVDMSHEAAIGKISREEIEYLEARGIDKDRAQSLIIRGFLDTSILALPDVLKKEINDLADKTLKSGL